MIIYSKVITPPATEPVSVEEAKTHLRVIRNYDDAYITTLIKVARRLCESYSGLSFITQQREMKLDYFPCGNIEIPNGPVQSIDDFVYIDSEGNEQTLIESVDFGVELSADIPRLYPLESWPTSKIIPGALTIAYTAGWTNDDHNPIPPEIKQAILLTVGSLYENRQDEITGASANLMNWNSKALLDTLKIYYNASY